MSSLARKFHIGRAGILLAAGIGVAAVMTTAKPAKAGVWIGVEVPAPVYTAPPVPYRYGYAYSYPPAYAAPRAYYRYPAYGYARGFSYGDRWEGHRWEHDRGHDWGHRWGGHDDRG
jgi:hypothetical protein